MWLSASGAARCNGVSWWNILSWFDGGSTRAIDLHSGSDSFVSGREDRSPVEEERPTPALCLDLFNLYSLCSLAFRFESLILT
mmetsp:Transcript_40416/g.68924  ORF Transcript_40416/g.68924 Transcript_40416/m.68924 type:complete len:83 (+) Transcript_40416:1357-1605(+)